MLLSPSKILATLAAIIALGSCASNANDDLGSKTPEHLDNASCLVADTTLHNLGQLGYADVISISKRITNLGTKPVRITSLDPDCSCITVVAEQDEILPDQSVKLNIEFDTRGNTGKQYHLINLKGDNGQVVKIYIFAEISEP